VATAAELVRAGRLSAGLSQSELARRAHIPQPSISRIEAGDRDPSIGLLDRLLAPAGQHLVSIPTRTPTVAEAASTIGQLVKDARSYVFRALIQVANDLADAEPALRIALSVTPPPPTGLPGADAFLAAVVEYRLAELPCPAWVNEPNRFLATEWVASGLTNLADLSRSATPEAFLRRGVVIHETDLVSY
jgi:transcriptional regulator with XRE-family HTH domain